MTTTASKFTAGQTLTARSVCDYDCIWTATVTKRTAKRITLKLDGNGSVTVGILTGSDGNEFCFPLGRYSMAPIFRA